MDGGGNNWLFALEFFGFAGLTLALAFHQLWALRKYKLKQLEKQRAAEADATLAS
jgi:hypothetical protein